MSDAAALPRRPQAIAADPAINAFVMANAGSGKTTTLVDRVARLLLNGPRPDAVLCLTFTKAAAAEMQRRLYQRLGGWAVAGDQALREDLARLEEREVSTYRPDELSAARALFARALETPGGLKIQTIHAFCEQLLRRFPVEAGLSPLFRVIDDVDAAAIRAAARDRVAEMSLTGDPPQLGEAYAALSEALDYAAFEAMFARFEERRAAIAAYVAACGGFAGLPAATAALVGLDGWTPVAAVEARFADIDLEAWMTAADACSRGNPKGDAGLCAAMRGVVDAVRSGASPVEAIRGVFLTQDGQPRKTVGSKAVDPEALEWLLREQDRVVDLDQRLRAARVAEDTVNALTLAGAYAEAYAEAKAARGVLDFADLIVRARNLLVDGPGAAWVLYKLDGGIDHILVDEAQDTSPEQWDIVRALTAEFFAGAGARPEAKGARTVFVVGDEKQSIFSFQGAAPERLLAESQSYRQMVEGAGARFETVDLLHSWRSTREVLAFVDQVFFDGERARALSPGRGLIGDRADVVIKHIAGREDLPGTVDVWEPERETPGQDRDAWDEPMDAEPRHGARRRVAERIVAEIRSLVERGEGVHAADRTDSRRWRAAGWGDVLVLVKKRGAMFEEVLRALKRSGVPVAGADRLQLSKHPVFEDLLALARTALYPDDSLSLAGVLRSPLCDVGEDALFELAHGRGRGVSLWRRLCERREVDPSFDEAAALIDWVRQEARTASPFDLFARLLNRVDGGGLTIRQRILTRLGAEAGDAMDAFLDQALAAEGRGVVDLERFAHALAALDQTVKREMDEPRGEVRVMTTHSAKGLEAPIVILPDTLFQDPRGDALLETEDGAFLWCGSSKGDCLASADARELRKRKGEEESLRLLYVGLTRARDRLIIGGRINARDKLENARAWWAPTSAALEALADKVRDVETPHGLVRRYGADPVLRPGARAAEPAPVAMPDWLSRRPPTEASARRLSPSRLGAPDAALPAPSPLAGTGGGPDRFRRGDLIHRLLERLPEVASADRARIAERILAREPGLTEDQRAEMIAAAFGVLDDARFAEVFGPDSRAEAALSGSAPELPPGAVISGRIDRLVLTPRRVLIVDYKTNRPAPDRIEDADPAYVLQMAVYAAVLRRLYPKRAVEAALVWTDGPRLMPVPQGLMDAALAAAR